MGKRKITFVVAVALVLILILPTSSVAETSFIENDEVNLAYTQDKTSLRYWYEGSDYKQTFALLSLREYASDGLSLPYVEFDESKVDIWQITETSQSVLYEIDDYRGLKRYHITVAVEIEFNHIEMLLTVIRWDLEVSDAQLKLSYIHNGQGYIVTLDDNWYFKRITITSTDALGSEVFSYDFLNFAMNISNSVLLILLTTLAIISLTLTVAYKKKNSGSCD